MHFLPVSFFTYGLLWSLSSAVPLISTPSENVVDTIGLAARGVDHADALAEPIVRREAGLEVRHGGLPEAIAPAALESRDANHAVRAEPEESRPEKRRLPPGAGAAAVPALAARDAEPVIAERTASDEGIDGLALAPRKAAPVPPKTHETEAAAASAAAPMVSGLNAPLPTTYAPGWCGLHVRQVLWNTCLRFNHQDCVRVNHTVSLFDGKQQLLARYPTAALTFDGQATMLLASALPFPVNVTQLGVVAGNDLTPGSPNIGNFWPVMMGYAGETAGGNGTWRNDERPRCRSGPWQNYLENRDFDCGFQCPPPPPGGALGGPAAAGPGAQKAVEL